MSLPQDINTLHKEIKAHKYTCVDLVDRYLARINNFDKKINSFNTVSDDYAYKKAKKLDQSFSEKGSEVFKEYPLFGVVISLKDIYLTKGIRTTASSNVLKDYIPPYSATIVERLEKAGAIIIGKTNHDAWAHGASGENSDFGPTKNPWNLEYVPGGSSSGSAASVSADFALASMGTDTGGSIRQPASFTNLVGYKPTYGAIPRYGVIAMASSFDTMGHFTHTVEDCEKIFNVTHGPDGHDANAIESEYAKTKSKYKIGIPKEYFEEGLDPQVKKIVENAIQVYKKEGIEIVDISLPNTKYAIPVYYIIQTAEVSSNLGRFDGVRYGYDRSHFGDEAKRRIMLGSYVLSAGYYDAYYVKAMKVRSLLVNEFSNAFDKVDAILAPVSPTPPFKIGEKSADPLSMYLADLLTASANIAGIPAMSIPAGFTKSNLPVGLQLMGKRWNEPILFDLGKLYQSKTDWHTKLPPLK